MYKDLGGDSFYGRKLLDSNPQEEVYFKPILTNNKVPSIPSDDSGYNKNYKRRDKDIHILNTEWNPTHSYQEQSKAVRNEKHDDILVNKRPVLYRSLQEHSSNISDSIIPIPKNNMSPLRAIRLVELDESNPEIPEFKGTMKRMTGGDNPLLSGPAGSMSGEARMKWILSSIDEDLLNSSRSDSNNNSYTVNELKDFLRQLGLKVSGNKEELVERLLFEKDLLNFDVD